MTLDDKYTYPGSGGVLVNRRGIRDPARLDQALNDYASAGWFALRREPPPERLDFDYLQRIHRQMFSELFDWAGQTRETDATAVGTGIAYARPEYIEESARSLFERLGREDYLRGLDRDTFAQRLAERWGELSAIHPFRDGNTRSQSAYVSTLAQRAGHPIDWTRVDVPTLRDLRLLAITAREQPLGDYLRDRLVDVSLDVDRPLDRFREDRGRGNSRPAGLDPSEAARLAGMDTPRAPRAEPPASRRATDYGSPQARASRLPGPEHGIGR